MAVFAATLSGFREGVVFLFTPDFSVLLRPTIWSAAFGQAFFSLSVGYGVLITYGVYLERNTNIASSALIIAVADVVVALLAGLIIFPLVFTFGLTPAIGAELAFSTLPRAFDLIPGGRLVGVGFFLLLFFAGLTSAISMMEVGAAGLMAKGFSRRKACMILSIALLIVGLIPALSYSRANLSVMGTRVLDFLDGTVGTMGLPITAFLMAVVFTWFVRRDDVVEEMGLRRGLSSVVFFINKVPIPALLLLVTLSRLVSRIDFQGWHLIPGVPYLETFVQAVWSTLLLLLVVAIPVATIMLGWARRMK
jgi:NSS family neurotransmitter:Na+ symporter